MRLRDCVFCEIANGVAPAEIDHWDNENEAVIFKPLNPVTEGHRLVVPFAHVVDFAESPNTTAAVMRSAAMFAHRSDQACNLITSKGEAATQSVFHLHVHVVPRWEGDGLALPWTDQRPAPTCDQVHPQYDQCCARPHTWADMEGRNHV